MSNKLIGRLFHHISCFDEDMVVYLQNALATYVSGDHDVARHACRGGVLKEDCAQEGGEVFSLFPEISECHTHVHDFFNFRDYF